MRNRSDFVPNENQIDGKIDKKNLELLKIWNNMRLAQDQV